MNLSWEDDRERFIEAVKSPLMALKRLVIDKVHLREELLSALGEVREFWEPLTFGLATADTGGEANDYTQELLKLMSIEHCLRTANGIAEKGRALLLKKTTEEEVTQSELYRAMRLVLCVLGNFLDDGQGYFVDLLGQPNPLMHVAKKFKWRGY